jgi:hypothetical protein
LLPDIPLPLAPTAPLRVKKAPARPPPPREEERPDLSMFRGRVWLDGVVTCLVGGI